MGLCLLPMPVKAADARPEIQIGDGKTAGSPYVMTAPNEPDTSISISGGERDTGDGNWDVDTDQYIQLTLGEY